MAEEKPWLLVETRDGRQMKLHSREPMDVLDFLGEAERNCSAEHLLLASWRIRELSKAGAIRDQIGSSLHLLVEKASKGLYERTTREIGPERAGELIRRCEAELELQRKTQSRWWKPWSKPL